MSYCIYQRYQVADKVEHAHLSILCEIRGLLYHQLGMTNDEIANLFEQWYNDKVGQPSHGTGPTDDVQSDMLRGNFLIGIGFKGLRFKEGDGIKDDRGIVEGIEDKVTQDVDLSEVSIPPYRRALADKQGTGTWSTRVWSTIRAHADHAGNRRPTRRSARNLCIPHPPNHLFRQARTTPGRREPQDPTASLR